MLILIRLRGMNIYQVSTQKICLREAKDISVHHLSKVISVESAGSAGVINMRLVILPINPATFPAEKFIPILLILQRISEQI